MKIALGLVVLALLGTTVSAAPRTVTATATLSVIAPSVERVTAAGPRAKATDGMSLEVGDRVVTGGSGVALITFLDGSTVTVQPKSDVVVREADTSRRDSSTIDVFINAGTVWARVARLVDPRSRLSLQSNTATATVRDGLIGAHSGRDEFHCWTQAGALSIVSADGKPLTTIAPGQMAEVKGGKVRIDGFAVQSATLAVEASPTVLPLLQMPYHSIVAGFVGPGIEVNQVYGSTTLVQADGRRTIEVPAGDKGPYTIVLEPLADGPFEVVMRGLYRGSPNYRLVFRGQAAKGERLWTSVNQEMPERAGLSGGSDRPSSAQAARFRPMRGELGEKIWLSPREIESAGR